MLRAELGLRGGEDPAVGPEEVQPREPAAEQQHEECRRGHEHRPVVPGDHTEGHSRDRRPVPRVCKG